MNEAWLDGEFCGLEDVALPLNSAAVRYGQVVFDAARVVVDDVGVARTLGVDHHLERFRASCGALGFELPWSNEELKRVACEIVRRNAPSAIAGLRWFAWARAASFGAREAPSVCVFLVSLAGYAPDRPLAVGVSSACRSATGDLPRRIKATSHYVAARWVALQAADDAVDEWIFRNEWGRLTESARSSLVLLSEGALVAPPVSEGVLPGITRAFLQALTERFGPVPWRQRPLAADALQRCDGALLCSSSLGIALVGSADGVPLAAGAPLQEIIRLYDDAVHGRLDGIGDWVELVEPGPKS
ncbi:MAG: aminotransferase class IV [Acidobacteriota bacterium]